MLESLQSASYAVVTIFFLLSTSSILLRCYTRGVVVKSFGLDDWCMSAILFFNAGHVSIIYFMLMNGGGLHIQVAFATNPHWLTNLIYALFIEEIYYVWMHWIIKTAFLLFYLRFATTKPFRYMIYGTMGLNTLTALSTWIIYFLQCMPLDAYFHPAAHPTATCLDKSIQAFVPATLNVFIDILIVVLPIRPLWTIQVSLRKRLMLISVVCLGGIVVLISSLRMIVLREFEKEADITYTLGELIIISSIEIDVAILAANGPSLKTFWSRFISRTMKASNDGGYGTSGKKTPDLENRREKHLTSRASCLALRRDVPSQGANGSVVELMKNDSAIVVTSSVGVERTSVETAEKGEAWVPDAYHQAGMF